MKTIRVTSEQLHARAHHLFTEHPGLMILPEGDCRPACCPPDNVDYAAISELESIVFLLDTTYSQLVSDHTPVKVVGSEHKV